MNTARQTISGNQAKRLRVGAVSYLNTKPLVYGLGERLPQAELVFDLPSRLADQLAAGELDVALIPTIEYFQNPTYRIVSDACIACRGSVLSVRMFSRVPADRIRTLALDEGSRTSVALLRVLLWERFHLAPELVTLPIGACLAEATTDAVLLIGDRAIHADERGFVEIWDLGDEWCRWAEASFVFAMWTSRAGVDCRELETAFAESRDAGLRNLEVIAAEAAEQVRLPAATCLSYLRDNLYFHLGPRERRGLALFYQYSTQLGLAPSGWTTDSLESPIGGIPFSGSGIPISGISL